jgi:murein DD-endopeptidase MepM/ murein hydrolase activator NlpD
VSAAAVLGLLVAGVLALAASGLAAADSLRVVWHPAQPRVGDLAWLYVRGVSDTALVEGSVAARPVRFFQYAGGHAAVVGFDLDDAPGPWDWQLAVLEPDRAPRTLAGTVEVRERVFKVQRLRLPSAMVDLAPEIEQRARAESSQLRAIFETVTGDRLWRGSFTRPIGGEMAGTGFGARRIINDQPRAPHAGIDYAAPWGTPVVAPNDGRVALIGEYFFPGRLVVLDHGLGLYTLYFHLERIAVRPGEAVVRGQPIGTVGSTGRSTGPHLHFGVQLGLARVDPDTLLGLTIRD